MTRRRLPPLLLAGLVGVPQSVTADDIFVPLGGDIQQFVDNATDGDRLVLEAGTHVLDDAIVLQARGITIAGDTSNPKIPPATLLATGPAGAFLVSGFAANPVVFSDLLIQSGNDSRVGRGITIAQGRVELARVAISGFKTSARGAAIDAINSDLVLEDCQISLCEADGIGGAISATFSVVAAHATKFEGNASIRDGRGGAIASLHSSLALESCTLQSNQSGDGELSGYGGAVYVYEGSVEAADCDFLLNSTNGDGGGLSARYSTVFLSGCEFVGNTTLPSACSPENPYPGVGGGLEATDCVLVTIEACEFRSNSANFGGGVDLRRSLATLYDCEFTDNAAVSIADCLYNTAWGGAVGIYYSDGNASNCRFEQNTADERGGAVSVVGSMLFSVVDSSVVENTAALGGGIYIFSGTLSLGSTRVCQNLPRDILGDYVDEGGNTVCCRGDLDYDGLVGGGDLGSFFASWGDCDGCPSDLNGDGTVNGQDLGLLFLRWGPCN